MYTQATGDFYRVVLLNGQLLRPLLRMSTRKSPLHNRNPSDLASVRTVGRFLFRLSRKWDKASRPRNTVPPGIFVCKQAAAAAVALITNAVRSSRGPLLIFAPFQLQDLSSELLMSQLKTSRIRRANSQRKGLGDPVD
jgi:hypothetical protein